MSFVSDSAADASISCRAPTTLTRSYRTTRLSWLRQTTTAARRPPLHSGARLAQPALCRPTRFRRRTLHTNDARCGRRRRRVLRTPRSRGSQSAAHRCRARDEPISAGNARPGSLWAGSLRRGPRRQQSCKIRPLVRSTPYRAPHRSTHPGPDSPKRSLPARPSSRNAGATRVPNIFRPCLQVTKIPQQGRP